MRYVMEGASTGRALLDAKQEFVRWINQQGRNPDISDEKTLLQFQLLGDPSIHPVIAAGEIAAEAGSDPTVETAAVASLAFERRRRRLFRRVMGTELRRTLPKREAVDEALSSEQDSQIAGVAQRALNEVFGGGSDDFQTDFRPLIQRVTSTVPQENVGVSDAVAAGGTVGTVEALSIAVGETFQYYWTARRKTERVVDARMVKVETNRDGEVLRTQVLVTA